MKKKMYELLFYKIPEKDNKFNSLTQYLFYMIFGLSFFLILGVISVYITHNVWMILLYIFAFICFCLSDTVDLIRKSKHDSK